MHPHGRLKLAVLISGRGSNMMAIVRACQAGHLDAEVVLVASDRADAAGLAAAAALGVRTAAITAADFADRDAFATALSQAIDRAGAQLVLLAGFMRILPAWFVTHYSGRMLNIHPSLLPKYKGLHTHRRALEASDPEHGASVHFVTPELDGGPVICQSRLAVLAGESEHALAARVLALEHRLYPQAVGLIAAGRLVWRVDGISLDGRALQAPLEVEGSAQG